ncbi:MAG: hypothetical protein JSV80_04710 [Acidobacteriota bacterium]|nr:MAG: hypothetical protein JSV80_04710 [Acidobacteriota bacterium]
MAQLFPEDGLLAEMGIESYVGTPLFDSANRPLGLLSVLGRQPMTDTRRAETMLRVFAVRAEAEIERLEAERTLRDKELQLRHSQELEAVGQLAGGIAHDFNNVLTVVHGYAKLLLSQLAPESPLRPLVVEIEDAGRRAGQPTSQLLTFSRRRATQRELIDVNDMIRGMENLLQRLIGENIELVLALAPEEDAGTGSRWVEVDLVEIEQVIMNLAVNARDAMPAGGRLSIETAELAPGEVPLSDADPKRAYVRPRISDTGVGIDEQVGSHIFEPFYTTKAPGRGTGLGLATNQAIVRQSGGLISVISRPGQGASFEVDLPAHPVPIAERSQTATAAAGISGS